MSKSSTRNSRIPDAAHAPIHIDRIKCRTYDSSPSGIRCLIVSYVAYCSVTFAKSGSTSNVHRHINNLHPQHIHSTSIHNLRRRISNRKRSSSSTVVSRFTLSPVSSISTDYVGIDSTSSTSNNNISTSTPTPTSSNKRPASPPLSSVERRIDTRIVLIMDEFDGVRGWDRQNTVNVFNIRGTNRSQRTIECKVQYY